MLDYCFPSLTICEMYFNFNFIIFNQYLYIRSKKNIYDIKGLIMSVFLGGVYVGAARWQN